MSLPTEEMGRLRPGGGHGSQTVVAGQDKPTRQTPSLHPLVEKSQGWLWHLHTTPTRETHTGSEAVEHSGPQFSHLYTSILGLSCSASQNH